VACADGENLAGIADAKMGDRGQKAAVVHVAERCQPGRVHLHVQACGKRGMLAAGLVAFERHRADPLLWMWPVGGGRVLDPEPSRARDVHRVSVDAQADAVHRGWHDGEPLCAIGDGRVGHEHGRARAIRPQSARPNHPIAPHGECGVAPLAAVRRTPVRYLECAGGHGPTEHASGLIDAERPRVASRKRNHAPVVDHGVGGRDLDDVRLARRSALRTNDEAMRADVGRGFELGRM